MYVMPPLQDHHVVAQDTCTTCRNPRQHFTEVVQSNLPVRPTLRLLVLVDIVALLSNPTVH